MAKRCPPGVLCIENFTLFILLLVCFGIVYFMRFHMLTQYDVIDRINNIKDVKEKIIISPAKPKTTVINTTKGNMLLDPNVPPLKKPVNYVDTRERDYSDKGVPINIRTRGNRLGRYTQLGFLKGLTRRNLIYPLYGRPNDTSRDKWNYYTLNDTGIKLPISKGSRSCTNEYGCDQLFDGDNVYVEGIDSVFVATIYENETNRYIPYL
jgi:hypothetical protein